MSRPTRHCESLEGGLWCQELSDYCRQMGWEPFCKAIGVSELGLKLKDGLSDLSWSTQAPFFL